ncbi:hypothetical protein SEVIR_2G366833v4 [Setaria viridis]
MGWITIRSHHSFRLHSWIFLLRHELLVTSKLLAVTRTRHVSHVNGESRRLSRSRPVVTNTINPRSMIGRFRSHLPIPPRAGPTPAASVRPRRQYGHITGTAHSSDRRRASHNRNRMHSPHSFFPREILLHPLLSPLCGEES